MRRLLAFAAATGTAVAAACVPLWTSPAAATAPNYVALGDSYSAASGVLPLDLTAPLNCARSTLNYGHLIAKKPGFTDTDVTCGGAETTHFFTAQYPNAPAQLNAINASTDLVTMTIGGNDSGVFINTKDSSLECAA